MGNIVAIVGRPNVGKSTFFNRMVGGRMAIVNEESGVTRDRIYGTAEWTGNEFTVIDTGGWIANSDDTFEKQIKLQVEIAIQEADVILFMVDVTCGITDLDSDVAQLLRRSKKEILLVVNKVDNNKRRLDINEFYSLGFGELHAVSSISGSGTGDLLDVVVSLFKKQKDEEVSDLPKFAIIGRPNVGKSSLVNTLLGEERNIVTPIAGTTRDAIHTRYSSFGFDFLLIDTAGLRKKEKVHDNLEFYSVIRAIKTIEESDVCLIMIDAVEGIQSQDINIFHVAQTRRKGIVILVNKWDLVEKERNITTVYEETIRKKIAPFNDVPIVFVSALTKQRVIKAVETAIEVYKNRTKHITTSVLNNTILPLIQISPPPAIKGKYINIKYITQLPTHAPSFALFCNLPQYIKEPYKRFVENLIREKFNFTGVPLQVFFRKK